MLAYLLQGLGYGFAAAVQPGPFQTYLVSQTLQRGWRRTLPAAFAPLLSDGPIIVLALLLLNQLPAGWERFLYVIGGLFVLFLARGAFLAWRGFDTDAAPSEAVAHDQRLLKAALTNALSPGPYLFWGLVTGPILLAGWRDAAANGVGFLLGFYGAMVGVLMALIVAFSGARRLGPEVNKVLLGLSAVALAGFGLYQLLRGVL